MRKILGNLWKSVVNTDEAGGEEDRTSASADRAAIAMSAIGTVHNGVGRRRRTGWESVDSRIELRPDLSEAVRGLDGFSHLIVLTWLHLAAAEPRDSLSLHPGGDTNLPRLGVLALRVSGRPNPIGCSVVKLLRVEGSILYVHGLDAIDGTPVLDIKPYLPLYDSVPDARLPGWALPR